MRNGRFSSGLWFFAACGRAMWLLAFLFGGSASAWEVGLFSALRPDQRDGLVELAWAITWLGDWLVLAPQQRKVWNNARTPHTTLHWKTSTTASSRSPSRCSTVTAGCWPRSIVRLRPPGFLRTSWSARACPCCARRQARSRRRLSSGHPWPPHWSRTWISEIEFYFARRSD